jgi:hypothetical protein
VGVAVWFLGQHMEEIWIAVWYADWRRTRCILGRASGDCNMGRASMIVVSLLLNCLIRGTRFDCILWLCPRCDCILWLCRLAVCSKGYFRYLNDVCRVGGFTTNSKPIVKMI